MSTENKTLAERVAEDLKDHAYTQLVNENGVEVWRCAQPGSSIYGFDICVTRFGMSVMGDIGSLVFHVGASYGINFLRHKSDGYVYEKLDENQKKQVIDFDAVRDIVCECIAGRIEEAVGEDELPEWIAAIPNEGAPHEQAEALTEWMRLYEEDDRLPFKDLIDVIESVDSFSDGRDGEVILAYDFIREHEGLIGGSDLWERRISKPCPRLTARLCYVRHAANAIMAIKEAEVAAA